MDSVADRRDVILIVDDNPNNLDLLARYLKRSGFTILTAPDGRQAVQKATDFQPDLILLDVMMPELDGFDTCRLLKENRSTQNIPIIFTTALSDVESKVKAFQIGAVDYVAKPFERREVLARINTHLTIRKLQISLESEIAERKRVEVKLRQSAAQLQAQNEELDAFSHTVAHNLKNPLGAITGIAQLLAQDYGTMPRQDMKKYLDLIAQAGKKTTNIVQELLVLASVRQQDVEAVPLEMEKIVEEAQQRLANLISASQAEIILPAQWITALGHPPWIEEVWVNYLSNALKYGGRPPKIELGSVLHHQNQARFWIKDNGNGLTAAEQARLFTPFTQLSKIKVKGHGLGLSIVRRIINKLGGDVTVSSTGESGQGSEFSFTLPIPRPDWPKAENNP